MPEHVFHRTEGGVSWLGVLRLQFAENLRDDFLQLGREVVFRPLDGKHLVTPVAFSLAPRLIGDQFQLDESVTAVKGCVNVFLNRTVEEKTEGPPSSCGTSWFGFGATKPDSAIPAVEPGRRYDRNQTNPARPELRLPEALTDQLPPLAKNFCQTAGLPTLPTGRAMPVLRALKWILSWSSWGSCHCSETHTSGVYWPTSQPSRAVKADRDRGAQHSVTRP